jgi:hypothetical protein
LDTYHVVLYLHLLSLLIGVGGAAVIGVCLFRLRAAQSLMDAVPWAMLAAQAERVFPVAVVGLFASGAYMTSDVWTWSTRWIDVSIAGLALIAVQGPLVAGRRAKALENALHENGPGPLGERARRLTRDQALWVIAFANPGIVLGIVWDMTMKPGIAEAVAAVLGGYAVGAAIALWFAKSGAVEATAITEPAA